MIGAWKERSRPVLAAVVTGMLVVVGTACNIGTDLDDLPTTARLRVEGTAPDTMKMIVSTDFFEQINLGTLERYAVLEDSDTLALALPYDETWQLNELGSVYVELWYEPTSTASITLRVNLDNGESFEQAATMSDDAKLIYYWVWSGPLGG